MAVKDRSWSNIPVNNNDISNAFRNASVNIDKTMGIFNDYLEGATERATGEAQNALARATNALEVNQVLEEAFGNSWVDNSALGKAGQEKKDTFFNQEMETEKLKELLLDNAHSRGMAEANYGLNVSKHQFDMMNSNRNFDLNVSKYATELEKQAYERERNEIADQRNAEKDALSARKTEADIRNIDSRTLGYDLSNADFAVNGNPKNSKKDSSSKTTVGESVLYQNDGGKSENQWKAMVGEVARGNPNALGIASAYANNFRLNTGENIDFVKTEKELIKEGNVLRNQLQSTYNNQKIELKDVLGNIQLEAGNSKNYAKNYELPVETIFRASSMTGKDTAFTEKFLKYFQAFEKDPEADHNRVNLFNAIVDVASRLPNGNNLLNTISEESFTNKVWVDTPSGESQQRGIMTMEKAQEIFRLLNDEVKLY